MSVDHRARTVRPGFVTAGLVLSVVAVVASAAVVWFFAGLAFFGEPLRRVDYLHMTLAFGLAAVLLLLDVASLRLLGAVTWVVGLAIALAVGCALLAAATGAQIPGAPRGESGEPWWWAVEFFLVLPTTWPAIALAAAAPWLRGRSRPGPR